MITIIINLRCPLPQRPKLPRPLLITLFFFKLWPFKCLLICIKVHPTPYKLVLYLGLVCVFLGLLPLNGFSQSETNQLDGLKNMSPSVFLIKHWMESCAINYDCWMHHCLDLHYFTKGALNKVTVVTGKLSFLNRPRLALVDWHSHGCCTQIVEEKRIVELAHILIFKFFLKIV